MAMLRAKIFHTIIPLKTTSWNLDFIKLWTEIRLRMDDPTHLLKPTISSPDFASASCVLSAVMKKAGTRKKKPFWFRGCHLHPQLDQELKSNAPFEVHAAKSRKKCRIRTAHPWTNRTVRSANDIPHPLMNLVLAVSIAVKGSAAETLSRQK